MSDNENTEGKIDEEAFIEAVRSVSEIIQSSEVKLTQSEIAKYFKDLNLTEAQQGMVYDYLQKYQSSDSDLTEQELNIARNTEQLEETNRRAKTNQKQSTFFQMYLKELQGILPCLPKEEEMLYEQLIAGDKEALHKLSSQWLPKVYKIAEECAVPQKDFADAIQEGNLSVFLVLNNMLGSGRKLDFKQVLEQAAKKAMEEYLYKAAAAEDMDNSLLAKAALVYEAQKFLAQEMQRIPTMEELSQYTRLSVEELEDILALSKEN